MTSHTDDPTINASVDVEILRAVLSKEIHDKYKEFFKTYMLTPVGWMLLGDISAYYETHPDPVIDPTTFRIWFRIHRYPTWKTEKHSMYNTILDTIFNGAPVNGELLSSITKARTMASMKVAIDNNDTDELATLMADLNDLGSVTKTDNKMITESFESIITNAVRAGGLTWRLMDLNKSAGPISKGDLIVVGKRPETGGTSFLISEFTHMVHQLPEGKHALIINNEEYKTKIISRLVAAAIGVNAPTIYGDPSKYVADYHKFLGTKRIDVMSDGNISIYDVERVLKSGEYGLIGLNVLEKLSGMSKNIEDYQKLERLGAWCRRVSLEHGPVVAIVQADASAEGVEYPDQSMLYKTKTGLQAEADLLIMIGRSNADPEDVRGINVAKNKLPGTLSTEPRYRHIKTKVNFDIETGRFTSNVWK
jgi:hypothetical protein